MCGFRGGANGLWPSHNPKVAGSNPAPATHERPADAGGMHDAAGEVVAQVRQLRSPNLTPIVELPPIGVPVARPARSRPSIGLSARSLNLPRLSRNGSR